MNRLYLGILAVLLPVFAVASIPYRQENDAIFSGYLLPKSATGQALGSSTFKWEAWVNTLNGSPVGSILSSSRQILTTSPLTGGGDLSADRTIAIPAASSTVNGYLPANFFNYFWGKAESTISISTTAPLTGGGNLQANRTISMPAASSTVDGYLSGSFFNLFSGKAESTISITPVAPLSGGGNLQANRTISIPAATNVVDGYLTAVDRLAFALKASSTITLTPTAPLTGGGDLSANRTIAMPQGSSTADGYLNHNDAVVLFNKANSTATVIAIDTTNQIDWNSALGYTDHIYTKTLSGSTSFGFKNINAGQTIKVRITNAGSFTATFPSSGSSTVTWAANTPPTLTTGAHRDIFAFLNDGTSTFGWAVQNF